jgi:hypothetical protein
MKAKAVSALRRKRGLHRANGAEPQVVGLTPQTTDERKTDTLKRYILRHCKPVEPQKSIRLPPYHSVVKDAQNRTKAISKVFIKDFKIDQTPCNIRQSSEFLSHCGIGIGDSCGLVCLSQWTRNKTVTTANNADAVGNGSGAAVGWKASPSGP